MLKFLAKSQNLEGEEPTCIFQIDFRISPELVAEWQGTQMRTVGGAVKCKGLRGAPIK